MDYKEFLRAELIPAFGCTEPIALAYAAAKAKEVLGEEPDGIVANLSGNMIKNANSVKVPGTEGRKGIEISLVAGAFLGDADKKLEVLANIDKSRLEECDKLIEKGICKVNHVPGIESLYIDVNLTKGDQSSRVVIEHDHTNIILIEKNKEVIFEKDSSKVEESEVELSFDKIYDFAKEVDYSDIKEIFDLQMEYNYAIAKEGIKNDWGANIGSIILENAKDNEREEIAAYASAGSDARMSGCEMPVVINSGSGNQGITVAVPIIVYAKNHKIEGDILYRSLIFANLIGLYIKQGIGKLSAYCGVVAAASASMCGIAMLQGEDRQIIKETLSNALATNSGMICDGAKPSCAMKIASSIRSAFLALDQAKSGNSFKAGDGIVKDDIDKTVKTVGNIARFGMQKTDEVILEEMLNN
ncbi:serine dehydratase subunit alpha family protein [Peptoniphilus catoniae]|uniref:L-cysteine desulfidase family protein n=1 Tax=Peptoniphilus catoniae TaxID=1660341 RepID=UPI0010FEA622|nr:L-serine ammonia-lyase, iron-sulfur-dependent, subunit alpha [Peptoniphilus catoniae]